jgi:hypothetical protein
MRWSPREKGYQFLVRRVAAVATRAAPPGAEPFRFSPATTRSTEGHSLSQSAENDVALADQIISIIHADLLAGNNL